MRGEVGVKRERIGNDTPGLEVLTGETRKDADTQAALVGIERSIADTELKSLISLIKLLITVDVWHASASVLAT